MRVKIDLGPVSHGVKLTLAVDGQCGFCPNIYAHRIPLIDGIEAPRVTLPKGWRYISHKLICPDHEIVIRGGGEVVLT